MNLELTDDQILRLGEILENCPDADPATLMAEGHIASDYATLNYITQHRLRVDQLSLLEHDPQEVESIVNAMTPNVNALESISDNTSASVSQGTDNKQSYIASVINDVLSKLTPPNANQSTLAPTTDLTSLNSTTGDVSQGQENKQPDISSVIYDILSKLTPSIASPGTLEPTTGLTSPNSTTPSVSQGQDNKQHDISLVVNEILSKFGPTNANALHSTSANEPFSVGTTPRSDTNENLKKNPIEPFVNQSNAVLSNSNLNKPTVEPHTVVSYGNSAPSVQFKTISPNVTSTIGALPKSERPTNENLLRKSVEPFVKERNLAVLSNYNFKPPPVGPQRAESNSANSDSVPSKSRYTASVDIENSGGTIRCNSYAMRTESGTDNNRTYQSENDKMPITSCSYQKPIAESINSHNISLPNIKDDLILTKALFEMKTEVKKTEKAPFSKFNLKLKNAKTPQEVPESEESDGFDMYMKRIKGQNIETKNVGGSLGAVPKKISPKPTIDESALPRIVHGRICGDIEKIDENIFCVDVTSASSGVPQGKFIMAPFTDFKAYLIWKSSGLRAEIKRGEGPNEDNTTPQDLISFDDQGNITTLLQMPQNRAPVNINETLVQGVSKNCFNMVPPTVAMGKKLLDKLDELERKSTVGVTTSQRLIEGVTGLDAEEGNRQQSVEVGKLQTDLPKLPVENVTVAAAIKELKILLEKETEPENKARIKAALEKIGAALGDNNTDTQRTVPHGNPVTAQKDREAIDQILVEKFEKTFNQNVIGTLVTSASLNDFKTKGTPENERATSEGSVFSAMSEKFATGWGAPSTMPPGPRASEPRNINEYSARQGKYEQPDGRNRPQEPSVESLRKEPSTVTRSSLKWANKVKDATNVQDDSINASTKPVVMIQEQQPDIHEDFMPPSQKIRQENVPQNQTPAPRMTQFKWGNKKNNTAENVKTGVIDTPVSTMPPSKFKWANKNPKTTQPENIRGDSSSQLPPSQFKPFNNLSSQSSEAVHPDFIRNITNRIGEPSGPVGTSSLTESAQEAADFYYTTERKEEVIKQPDEQTRSAKIGRFNWKNKITTAPSQQYAVTIHDDRDRVLSSQWDCRQILPDGISSSILSSLSLPNPAATDSANKTPQLHQLHKVIEDQISMLKEAFPFCDEDFIARKVEQCCGDSDQLQAVIEKDILPFIEIWGERKKIHEHELTRRFPGMEPNLIKRKCEQFKGDDVKFREFIQTQTLEIKAARQLDRLLALFPNHDPAFLQKKCQQFEGDDELFDNFIADENKRINKEIVMEEMLTRLLVIFPSHNPELLRVVCYRMDGDEAKLEEFIVQEQEKERKRLVIDEQYERLRRTFPTYDTELLREECLSWDGSEFMFNDFVTRETEREQQRLIIEEQYHQLRTMFPDDDPEVLRDECYQRQGNQPLINELIKQKNFQPIFTNVLSILTDVDPAFVEETWEAAGGNPEAFNNLIMVAMETNNYPKIDIEAPEAIAQASLWSHYVKNFNLEDYLRRVPHPEEFLEVTGDNNPTDKKVVFKFLTARYPQVSELEFNKYYAKKKNLSRFCKALDKLYPPRSDNTASLMKEDVSERFLQEVAFINNRSQIMDHIKQDKYLRSLKVKKARQDNLLLPCQCCFDDLLYEEAVPCTKEHLFCKSCVQKHCEVRLGDGQTSINCMTECDGNFSSAALETALPVQLFHKLIQKQQIAEINEAHLDGIESCPFCEFVYIPLPGDVVFRCMNEDCQKESCRLCKEPSHIPLRCKEVERPKDLLVRQTIEEKMTEALVRKCTKCGKRFIKMDGCNKMTCSCGAIMCYICRQTVLDYNHFNGQGGANFKRCPLWSNNDELHVRDVQEVGRRARDEELQKNPDVHLVHDPTI